MEDLNTIMTAISTVGFPIAACVALYLQSREQNKAISEMSMAIQKLTDKIEYLIGSRESDNHDIR